MWAAGVRQAKQAANLVEGLARRVVEGVAKLGHAGGDVVESSRDVWPPLTTSAMVRSGNSP